MSKKVFLVLLLVLTLGLFPVGCRSESPGGGEIPPATGELNLYNIDPITLDPAVSGEMTSHEYIMQVFSSLVLLDETLEVVPDIAEKWEVGDNGRVYTFYLRKDVYFHDGRQVTAADFKYSWERTCKPETGSRTASVYLNDIVGAKEVLEGRAEEISGIKVIDDFALEVTIDAPKSYFLAKLTYPTAFVVDRHNVASGRDWWRQPNGTGPFKLKQWEGNNLLVLERNEHYYGKIASVSQVNYKLWGGVPMVMYETGDIDVTEIGMNYIDRVTDKSGPFANELQVVTELSFSYIGFDPTRPPFDDVDLRRAFSLAIDKEKIISVLLRDMEQRADGILPSGMPGFNEGLTGLGYDPDQARRLIAASKYGSVEALPPITITTTGWGGSISDDLEAIIQQWRENLGVEVTVRQLEPERFLYYLKEEKDEMFYMGWIADYPHPQDFLDVLFHTGMESNYGEYSNATVDAVLDRAAVEQDYEQSLKIYQQAEQMMVDDAACIPLWFGQNYVLVKPYVKGYRLNPMGIASLNEVSIAKE
ncbi:peptide ABC transporter substrate-binding protein [Chloroflexota bacterium]